MNTFTYKHVTGLAGGTTGATLYLDKWYVISEDGRVYFGPCDTQQQAEQQVANATEYDLTVTDDPAQYGLTAEALVCTGATFKQLYAQ